MNFDKKINIVKYIIDLAIDEVKKEIELKNLDIIKKVFEKNIKKYKNQSGNEEYWFTEFENWFDDWDDLQNDEYWLINEYKERLINLMIKLMWKDIDVEIDRFLIDNDLDFE